MRAIVHRIDHDIDAPGLADYAMLWLRDGLALAALGQALTIEVPANERSTAADRTDTALSSIDCDGDIEAYGTGPLAFAALPFATERAATIVVPEVIYGRDLGGTRWITWIGDGPAPSRDELVARLTMPARPHEHPRTFTVSSARTEHSWRASVAAVRDRLRAGQARKAVMARELDIACDAPVARWPVVERLRNAYASSFVFAVPCAAESVTTPWLVGATPELLVRRIGDIVRSQPMAGTTRRSADPQTDARLAALLLASHKDRSEHQITIDTVHETLLPWCSYLDSETEPSIVSVANVHHLATFVEGRLSKPLPSVLELVTALHPTPAVCGHPRDAARALIDEHEQMDRGSYAGAVGWVDRAGQGEWAVALRCAEIAGAQARLFAGGGIVVDSDPDAELEETRVKFETMLGAIVRP
ncbi:MAG TPA: isochorismate synthase [Acidimicrobiales bacterium]|nr:isochorismate synthase [Acidimicrobiales bacterium]